MSPLQDFQLADLAEFTLEKQFPPDASSDHRLFYVGRDDVHGVLMHLFSRVTSSIYLNMFGYDDNDLNALIMAAAENANVLTVITLDKSQSGGVHEKTILASDAAKDPAAYQAHFAIGQSASHQISHTKGGVLDGVVCFEGSTIWSASGEGTIPTSGARKAQNNTLLVFTDSRTLRSFRDELVNEHQIVIGQGGALKP